MCMNLNNIKNNLNLKNLKGGEIIPLWWQDHCPCEKKWRDLCVAKSYTIRCVCFLAIKYRIFAKYGPGVNYFQMASDQALN